MSPARSIFLAAACSILFHGTAHPGTESRHSWKGERLVYSLSWFKLNAGTSTLEVVDADREGNDKVLNIVAQTSSNSFVDTFYRVRDRIDSYIDPERLYSMRYKVHQEEGDYRRDKEIFFDYKEGRAIYKKDGKISSFEIKGFVSDALSSLYMVRTKDLKVGSSVYVDVFDDKKLWNVEVKVLKKERIETPAGRFDTLLIKPELKFEGIFQRVGDVYVWLTDDNRKIPVMMRSKIRVGSISADLIEYSPR